MRVSKDVGEGECYDEGEDEGAIEGEIEVVR